MKWGSKERTIGQSEKRGSRERMRRVHRVSLHTLWTCVTGVRRLKLRDSDLQRTTRNTMLPILL